MQEDQSSDGLGALSALARPPARPRRPADREFTAVPSLALPAVRTSVRAMALSHNGSRLAVATGTSSSMWCTMSGRCLADAPHPPSNDSHDGSGKRHVVISSCGAVAVSLPHGDDDDDDNRLGVALWSCGACREVAFPSMCSVELSADGAVLVGVGGSVAVAVFAASLARGDGAASPITPYTAMPLPGAWGATGIGSRRGPTSTVACVLGPRGRERAVVVMHTRTMLAAAAGGVAASHFGVGRAMTAEECAASTPILLPGVPACRKRDGTLFAVDAGALRRLHVLPVHAPPYTVPLDVQPPRGTVKCAVSLPNDNVIQLWSPGAAWHTSVDAATGREVCDPRLEKVGVSFAGFLSLAEGGFRAPVSGLKVSLGSYWHRVAGVCATGDVMVAQPLDGALQVFHVGARCREATVAAVPLAALPRETVEDFVVAFGSIVATRFGA